MCTSAAAVKVGRKLYKLGIAFHLSPSMRITASLPIMQSAFISCALVTYGCPLHSYWCSAFVIDVVFFQSQPRWAIVGQMLLDYMKNLLFFVANAKSILIIFFFFYRACLGKPSLNSYKDLLLFQEVFDSNFSQYYDIGLLTLFFFFLAPTCLIIGIGAEFGHISSKLLLQMDKFIRNFKELLTFQRNVGDSKENQSDFFQDHFIFLFYTTTTVSTLTLMIQWEALQQKRFYHLLPPQTCSMYCYKLLQCNN